MTRYMRFDAEDKAILHALDDDFAISSDGETATVAGEMTVKVTRPIDNGGTQLWLTLTLPGGEELEVKIQRCAAPGAIRYQDKIVTLTGHHHEPGGR
jgi:hypothetical protein